MALQGPLSGKVALVTGAGRRIGRAVSLALADEGVHVVAHYASAEADVARLCSEVQRRGVKSWPLQADFARPEGAASVIERCLSAAGGLDFVVNNASIFRPSTFDDVDFAGVVEHLRVNAWVPLVLSRDFARLVGAGKIVNMLDSRITDDDPAHVAYILSKQALAALTRTMAVELAPTVTVNAVAPGLILPPPGENDDYVRTMADTTPLRRHGEPSQIADAVVYLLKSDFTTGQVLFVDGGRHIMEYAHGSHRHS